MKRIVEDYIRGFKYDGDAGMPTDYTIESIDIQSNINRNLPIIIVFLFFAIFWLGMENYIDTVESIIEFFRQKRK